MKYLTYVGVAAGLVCWLAASPARADLAAPEAGSAQVASGQVLSALQALTVLMDAAATIPESSALASETKSNGPLGTPSTSQGVDRSNGFAAGDITGFGPARLFPAALPPAGLLPGEGSHFVATPPVPSVELPSLASSTSSLPSVTGPGEPALPPTVPIPAPLLLLGGGLAGLFPFCRSARRPPAV
jgi:hypothetical protein